MMYFNRFLLFLILTAGVVSGSLSARAEIAASDWIKTEQTEVRLLAASQSAGTTGELKIGLQFKLQPGWKIYWRSPGDAGFPPQIDWAGSSNLKSAEIDWPTPTRFSVLGLETLGYKKEVVFPIRARAVSPNQNVTFQASIKYLTCSEICIPYDAELSLGLPTGPQTPSSFAHLIDRYRATVPGDGRAHGLEITNAVAESSDVWTGLRVTALASTPFESPDIFVEGAPGLAFAKPQITLSKDKLQAILDVKIDGVEYLDDNIGKTIAGRDYTFTLTDGGRSAEKALKVSLNSRANSAPPAPSTSDASLITILALALLGGLILNLMPCVLPVLSIKLIGAVGHGGGDTRAVRMSFIASATGILFSFMVLAAALVALKASGSVIGWGIQFQQPWFLIAMTVVVVLFACNLWGFFEMPLPRLIADLGEHSTHTHGLGGHFIQGAFATLLATPCSAPFLGTAVGFALARGPEQIFAVFAALGIGLALPYLCVALFPTLATRLPKPGPWMIRLKQVLGLALMATAAWLLSVITTTSGLQSALIIGGLMVAMIITLFAGHRTPRNRAKTTALATILALAALLFPANPSSQETVVSEQESAGIKWQSFNRVEIGRMVAAGRTVLVDVTADWCITCQVNKSLVLGRDPINSILQSGDIDTLQADWTLPSDDIANYLASFGRYGIPFNAVYGPNAPDGIILPELLNTEAILKAISEAQSSKNAKASNVSTN